MRLQIPKIVLNKQLFEEMVETLTEMREEYVMEGQPDKYTR